MRRILGLSLMLVVLATTVAHGIPIPGSFCDGKGQIVYGAGSLLQDDLHQRVFVPEYEAVCPKGIGTIRHLRLGQEAGFKALQDHDAFLPLVTVDRTMDVVAETTAENDLPERRGRFSQLAHMPLFVTPMAVIFNPPCAGVTQLNLTNSALSRIFTGLVLQWNDPEIVTSNPALANCTTTVKVATRVDDAASTATLKDYLSKRSPQWHAYRTGPLVNQWPSSLLINCQGLGETGMAACVSKSPGYIGYLTLPTLNTYPGLKAARVENAGQSFVAPSTTTCSQATQAAYDNRTIPRDAVLGDWTQVSLADADTGYPVCNISYMLGYVWLGSAYFGSVSFFQMRTLKDYVDVALRPSTQAKLTARGYTPLPPDVLAVSRQGWEALEFR